MKIKTSELIGAPLNWAVARCEGWDKDTYMMSPDIPKDINGRVIGIMVPIIREYVWYAPSTDWSQGGPIVEREGIELSPIEIDSENGNITFSKSRWGARTPYMLLYDEDFIQGPTPLIAAMRCYVASKLGNEVEIPEELL